MIRASTKSTTPSPLRSCRTTPGLKNSDSEADDVSVGAVRPTAPAHATRMRAKTFFMTVPPDLPDPPDRPDPPDLPDLPAPSVRTGTAPQTPPAARGWKVR